MVTQLRLTFEVLTPLYLGGADQSAELRAPSLKGGLRFWWRTLNPIPAKREKNDPRDGLAKKEARIFGGAGAGQGQAPFLLTVAKPLAGKGVWDDSLVRRFDVRGNNGLPQNGLRYLGYPFPMQDKEREKQNKSRRTCIAASQQFELVLLFPREPSLPVRRGLAAAIWLLGHLGGAGSRARRGFGSLALIDWTGPWEEMKQLPLLHPMATPERWLDKYDQVRRVLADWFIDEAKEEVGHPHFGPETKLILGETGHAKSDWAACLNEMGLAMQRFRQLSQPDYGAVKNHLQGRGLLERTPERASFGLPLTFRYRSLGGKSGTLVSKEGDRHGSLLHLRPTLINGRLYPLYLRLAGAVPGLDTPGRVRGWPDPLPPLTVNAMDRFLEQLKGVTRHG